MTTLENARQLTEYLQNRKYYTTEMSILRHFQWSRATFYRVLTKARQSGEEIESKRGIGYLLLANYFHYT